MQVRRDYDSNHDGQLQYKEIMEGLADCQKKLTNLATAGEDPNWHSKDAIEAGALAGFLKGATNTFSNNVGSLAHSSISADNTFAALEGKLAKDFNNAVSQFFS